MSESDKITVVVGTNQITKLLYELGEVSRLVQLVAHLKDLNPRKTDPKPVADVFLVGQRLFGLIVYGYSVTEWHVEMLFGPQSFEGEIRETIDDVGMSLGLPTQIIGGPNGHTVGGRCHAEASVRSDKQDQVFQVEFSSAARLTASITRIPAP
jgi:hypothetical protein